MGEALVHHLDVNRPLILGRALLSGAAGMLPVPYLDELLAGAVRRALIRRLAEIRGVDLDENALHAIAEPHASRLLSAATMGSVALGATRRAFRRIAGSLLVVRRVDAAMQTFQVGTLFDHYCARHHVGFGLDGTRAAELRAKMEQAVRETHGEALRSAFGSALRAPGQAALALPRFVYRGLGRRWRTRGEAPLDAEKLDEKLRHAERTGWLQRAVAAVGGVGQSYARGLAARFDEAWAAP